MNKSGSESYRNLKNTVMFHFYLENSKQNNIIKIVLKDIWTDKYD